ncbi:MAG TPA: serpin family protein [Chthoniobacterales bacterium]|jgi:serpin B|nr:serpin family protein [Chthoniobacterales bacterium]
MRPIKDCAPFLAIFFASVSLHAADFNLAANATNQIGVDLYKRLARGDENLCVSPYSIESALAMTFAGADGETKREMARVLHFPNDGDAIHASFTALQDSLAEMATKTAKIAEQSKKKSGPSEPITLSIANHLFAQSGYEFRDPFQALVKKFYGAPFETIAFKANPEAARAHINKWVADQTRDKIRDLIPQGGIKELTRLVLANAIYFKAPWGSEFNAAMTKPKPFHIRGGAPVDVPMMEQQKPFRFAKGDGFTTVAIPYSGSELQFVILMPDEVNGLAKLESGLSAEILKRCATFETQDVDLELPKFKFAAPTIALKENLETLGMKTAFDDPPGSANFDRISPRRPDKYLAISNVFHKTFIAVDEKGTEAAAATAVVMMEVTARFEKPKEPIHVKVDRPFVYAIQHVPSGTCLFIGRVTDPR